MMSHPVYLRDLLLPFATGYAESVLGDVIEELNQGRPLALRMHGEWHILSPWEAAGHKPTRRVIDLPLKKALVLSPNMSVSEAFDHLVSDEGEFALVGDEENVLGAVSKSAVQASLLHQGRQSVTLQKRFQACLEFGRILVWEMHVQCLEDVRIPLTETLRVEGPLKEMLGWDLDGLLGQMRSWKDLIHPDDLAEIVAHLRAILEDGGRVDQSLRFLHRKKAWVWLRMQITAKPTSGGVLLHGISGDASEQMALRQAQVEAEEIYQALADLTGTGIIVLHKGKMLYTNDRLSEMLGQSATALLRDGSFCELFYGEHQRRAAELLEIWARGEERDGAMSLKLAHRTGRPVPAEVRARKIRHLGDPALLITVRPEQ